MEHVRRLPIYGERAIDFQIRKLRATWTFGHWLYENFDAYEELIHAPDAEEDPYTVSLESVEDYFADPDSALVQEREGPHDLWPSFKSAKDTFLVEKLGELLSRRVLEKELAHTCFGALPEPLEEWPTATGVYYARHAGESSVKIGHGVNICKRLLGAKCWSGKGFELLAWEPGPITLETKRHDEFEAWWQKPRPGRARQGHEWYRLEGAVVEHIRTLRYSQLDGDKAVSQ